LASLRGDWPAHFAEARFAEQVGKAAGQAGGRVPHRDWLLPFAAAKIRPRSQSLACAPNRLGVPPKTILRGFEKPGDPPVTGGSLLVGRVVTLRR
jgi:hypothetical protein